MAENKDFDTLKLLGDVGWKENIGSLIKLCFLAADDEYMFASRVDVLWRALPSAVKEDEEFQEKIDACTTQNPPVWKYRYFGGVAMGTPEKPVSGSPYQVEGELDTDWKGVLGVVLDELERLNQTWRKALRGGST